MTDPREPLAHRVDGARGVAAVVQDARADARRLPDLLKGCHAILYADHRRDREVHHMPDPERMSEPRCGTCEHRVGDHEQGHCEHEDCRCSQVTPYPSTVGHAQWTGPGLAEIAYVGAVRHLQRAHDELKGVPGIAVRWKQEDLHRPASKTTPLPLHLALYGVRLMQHNLDRIRIDELDERRAAKVERCAAYLETAVRTVLRAQDKLHDDEHRALRVKRCVVPYCKIEHHANGMCRTHYDQNRRAS